jgi:hypothetical protein
MNGLFVSPAQLLSLRQRYEEWKALGFPEIDPHLQPVLERLNQLPGVATLSSCMGHLRTASKVKLPLYVSMAATESGATLVREVYGQIAQRLIEVMRAYLADAKKFGGQPSHFQVAYEELQLIETHKELELDGEQIIYNRLMLVAKNTHIPAIRDNFIKEFTIVLDRVLAFEEAAA